MGLLRLVMVRPTFPAGLQSNSLVVSIYLGLLYEDVLLVDPCMV